MNLQNHIDQEGEDEQHLGSSRKRGAAAMALERIKDSCIEEDEGECDPPTNGLTAVVEDGRDDKESIEMNEGGILIITSTQT